MTLRRLVLILVVSFSVSDGMPLKSGEEGMWKMQTTPSEVVITGFLHKHERGHVQVVPEGQAIRIITKHHSTHHGHKDEETRSEATVSEFVFPLPFTVSAKDIERTDGVDEIRLVMHVPKGVEVEVGEATPIASSSSFTLSSSSAGARDTRPFMKTAESFMSKGMPAFSSAFQSPFFSTPLLPRMFPALGSRSNIGPATLTPSSALQLNQGRSEPASTFPLLSSWAGFDRPFIGFGNMFSNLMQRTGDANLGDWSEETKSDRIVLTGHLSKRIDPEKIHVVVKGSRVEIKDRSQKRSQKANSVAVSSHQEARVFSLPFEADSTMMEKSVDPSTNTMIVTIRAPAGVKLDSSLPSQSSFQVVSSSLSSVPHTHAKRDKLAQAEKEEEID